MLCSVVKMALHETGAGKSQGAPADQDSTGEISGGRGFPCIDFSRY